MPRAPSLHPRYRDFTATMSPCADPIASLPLGFVRPCRSGPCPAGQLWDLPSFDVSTFSEYHTPYAGRSAGNTTVHFLLLLHRPSPSYEWFGPLSHIPEHDFARVSYFGAASIPLCCGPLICSPLWSFPPAFGERQGLCHPSLLSIRYLFESRVSYPAELDNCRSRTFTYRLIHVTGCDVKDTLRFLEEYSMLLAI